MFNPFCWNDRHTAESDLDPAVNVFNDISIESRHICESDAHDIYCNVNQKHFSLLHINCHSINKNITNIYTLLENVQADVIAVTETWLTTDDAKDINIPGYHFEYKCRIK